MPFQLNNHRFKERRSEYGIDLVGAADSLLRMSAGVNSKPFVNSNLGGVDDSPKALARSSSDSSYTWKFDFRKNSICSITMRSNSVSEAKSPTGSLHGEIQLKPPGLTTDISALR